MELTREQIKKMEAGREMDQLIYDQIFRKAYFEHYTHMVPDGFDFLNIPNYSTDISSAWDVVEKLIEDNFDLEGVEKMHRLEYRKWVCEFGYGKNYQHQDTGWKAFATADTAPLAICRAALLTTL